MNDIELEPIKRLKRDLKQAAATLSPGEARFLVDAYYALQEDRIRSGNQVTALAKSGEPHAVLQWFKDNSAIIERDIKSALDTYSSAHVTGRWAKSIVGIGPVIAAGLLAHVDLNPWRCAVSRENGKRKPCKPADPHGPACLHVRTQTVGHIWSFAGLNPETVWEKSQLRPWNTRLKTLCWKIGESFVKTSGRDEDFYGKQFLHRKRIEVRKNLVGDFAEQAALKLQRFRIGKDTEAYAFYSGCYAARKIEPGVLETAWLDSSRREEMMRLLKVVKGEPGSGTPMLPPGHVHARAKRWAVKLFLSHYHAVAYRAQFGEEAPLPYVLSHLGHTDQIQVPSWPF